MAETLTVDPTPDAEVAEVEGVSLTADEQDSLKVGEAMTEQQDNLLAGKYKDAEALEKAYIELQGKLGEKDGKEEEAPQAEAEQEEVLPETSEEKPTELSPAAELITTASDEYYDNDGKISPETLEKFSSMSSKDLVEAYMQVQSNLPQGDLLDTSADISDSVVNEVKNHAGGEEAYLNMVQWASNNLDQGSIDAFDNIINTGSVDAIKLAVNGLKSQYQEATGYEGTMVTGKAPTDTKDIYRSQAELVRAMSDKRYDQDPAYRQDVIEKLGRSGNLQF